MNRLLIAIIFWLLLPWSAWAQQYPNNPALPPLPQSATSAGNPNGSVGWIFNNPVNMFNSLPYGGGSDMAVLCIQIPFTNTQPCPINGGLTSPTSPTGEEADAALVVYNQGAPNDFGGALAATFTATTLSSPFAMALTGRHTE